MCYDLDQVFLHRNAFQGTLYMCKSADHSPADPSGNEGRFSGHGTYAYYLADSPEACWREVTAHNPDASWINFRLYSVPVCGTFIDVGAVEGTSFIKPKAASGWIPTQELSQGLQDETILGFRYASSPAVAQQASGTCFCIYKDIMAFTASDFTPVSWTPGKNITGDGVVPPSIWGSNHPIYGGTQALAPTFRPVVICADIGSMTRGKFAWTDSCGKSDQKPLTLAQRVADLMNSNEAVALGFECPLFVPFETDQMRLTRSRPGEGNRPWSAGAGAAALTTGLVQVLWVLQEIRRQLIRPCEAYLDWRTFAMAGRGLFIWEAFVTGKNKGSGDLGDANLGMNAFREALPDPQCANAINCTTPTYSLVGAALLRAGWSKDLGLLSQPIIVVRPGQQ